MKGEVQGLGSYSEQAMESIHKELMVDVKHPKYGEKLLKTTVRINGKHI